MAHRVEQIGPCELHLGDCREILPTLEGVDAVVTDPPYGLGDKWAGGGGKGKSSWKFDPAEARSWDSTTVSGVEELADFAKEVVIWGGNYYRMPAARCWLLWDKKQNDNWTTAQAEMAWTNLDRPVRTFRMAQCEAYGRMDKKHPTQKPLALMRWCLKWVTGETVLDPYMGSASTGVACVMDGRKFIGIEIDETYFEIACNRIRKAWQEKRSELPLEAAN